MHVISTIGPDNATNAVLPFIAAKGAMSQGDKIDLFLMQEATYLGSRRHSNLGELSAPGLPTVAAVLDALEDGTAIRTAVVCKPCATSRQISEGDLRPGFEFGGAGNLAAQADRNETTVTF